MTLYEESNSYRQKGLLSYVDNGEIIRLKSDQNKVPDNMYSALRRECRYIEPNKSSLLLFCDKATALTRCVGIYTVGTQIHLENRWFERRDALRDYLSDKETLPPNQMQKVIELLSTGDIDTDKCLAFEQITGCALYCKDGLYTTCGTTYTAKEAFIKALESNKPASFEEMAKQVKTLRQVQNKQAVILDEVAYIASNKKVYNDFHEDIPLKGIIGVDGKVAWVHVDKSKFTQLKTDHGVCLILKTLYKKSVRTLYTKVFPTDLLVSYRPYPIGILPDGSYSFWFRGKDGASIDQEDHTAG